MDSEYSTLIEQMRRIKRLYEEELDISALIAESMNDDDGDDAA